MRLSSFAAFAAAAIAALALTVAAAASVAAPGPLPEFFKGIEVVPSADEIAIAMARANLFVPPPASLNARSPSSSLRAGDDTEYNEIIPHSAYFDTVKKDAPLRVKVPIPAPADPPRGLSFIVAPRDDSDPDLQGRIDDGEKRASYGYGADIVYFSPEEIKDKKFGFFNVTCMQDSCDVGYLATFEEAIKVEDGQTLVSFLDKGEADYFSLDIPEGATSVTVSITQIKNKVTLLAADDKFPTSEAAKWRRDSNVMSPLLLKRADISPTDEVATLFVTIEGASDAESEYSITITTDKGRAMLRSGAAIDGAAVVGSHALYSFTNDDEDRACDIAFAVTARTGIPHLYVNFPGKKDPPSPEDSDKKSESNTRANVVSVLNTESKKGEYVISVVATAAQAAEFSVLAKLSCGDGPGTYTALAEGAAQVGYVAKDKWDYYSIHVPAAADGSSVIVSLVAESGDPDLYVKTDKAGGEGGADKRPSPTTAQWKSLAQGRDVVVINPSDEGYCTDCTYQIGVEGYIPAIYSISASYAASYTVLTVGASVEGVLPKSDAADFFVFRLAGAVEDDIAVILTNKGAGDPDVFVSLQPFVKETPLDEQAMWKGNKAGSDQVIIAGDDTKRCKDESCMYYVAISAFMPSSYSLLVSLDTPILLSSGSNQDGFVGSTGLRTYMVRVPSPAANTVSVTVNVYAGKGAAYFSRGAAANPAEEASYEHVATAADTAVKRYSFAATVPEGAPVCTDGATAAGECFYYIAIQGAPRAWYQIIATVEGDGGESSTALSDGIPFASSIAEEGAFQYFSFQVTGTQRSLVIMLTPSAGDADLFVSRTEPFPTANNTSPEEQSRSWGADALVFENAAPGLYYIGVQAASGAGEDGSMGVDFTILAATTSPTEEEDDSAPIKLIDGIPQAYYLAAGAHRSFAIQVEEGDAAHTDLMFTFGLLYGDVEFYAAYATDAPPKVNPKNATWDSSDSEASFLWVPTPAAGYYTISVYARGDAAALFSLTGTLDNTHVVLQNGVGVPGYLGTDEATFYRLTAPAGETMVISVASLYGNPDLYISDDPESPYPTKETGAQWKGEEWYDDAIVISPDDPARKCKEGRCTFYIAVYSAEGDTEYYVSATYARPATLVAGVSTTASVPANGQTFFALRVSSKNMTSLSISLLPTAGSPWVYVRTGSLPTETAGGYSWALRGASASGGRLEITPESAPEGSGGWCTGYKADGTAEECVYYMLVASTEATSFAITASPNTAATALREGATVTMSVTKDDYAYFYFPIQAPEAPETTKPDVMVIITPLSGSPDIYGAYNIERPTEEKHEFESSEWGVEVLTLKAAEAGQLYIGVHAARGENALFRITVRVVRPGDDSRTVQLADGVPQGGAVLADGWMYFTVTPSAAADAMDFLLSTGVGDADLYINANSKRPNATVYDYRSDSSGPTDEITVSDLATVFKDKKRIFTIGVVGYQSSVFTMLATSSGSIQRLQPGVPVRDASARGGKDHYMLDVDTATVPDGAVLEVSVTVFYGTLHLFGSKNPEVTHPDEEHNDAKASGFTDVAVSFPEVKPQTYYFTVECASSSCAFSVVASFAGHVTLINGVAQSSSALPGLQRKYVFTVPPAAAKADVSVTLLPITSDKLSLYALVGADPNPASPSKETVTKLHTNELAIALIPAAMLAECAATDKLSTSVAAAAAAAASACRVHITVVVDAASASGDDEALPATWSITAATDDAAIALQDGFPVRDWVHAGGYSYYYFDHDIEKADIGLIVTPATAEARGAVTIYLSTTKPRPDATAEWSSGFFQATPFIHIDPSTQGYKAKGRYFAAVYSPTATTYTITLAVTPLNDDDEGQSVVLLAGQPQSAVVANEAMRYFRFRSTGDGAVTFSVTPVYGDPDLFTNKNGKRPTAEKYDKKADGLGADQIVYTAADGCKNCWYDIAVLGWGKTLFTITAQTSSATLELQPGLPITNTLSGSTASALFYKISIPEGVETNALYIGLTPSSGDPDLFVSRTIERPSPDTCADCVDDDEGESCCFVSADLGADTITVPAPVAGATYYIGVYNSAAPSATTFSLVAYTGSVLLLPGVPQSASVRAHASVVYHFTVDDVEAKNEFSFTLSQNRNEYPAAMYIIAYPPTADPDDVVVPSPKKSTWSSTRPDQAEGGLRGVVRIHKGDTKACFDCTYLVAVYGSAEVASTAFTISASSPSSVVTLRDGVAVSGVVSNEPADDDDDKDDDDKDDDDKDDDDKDDDDDDKKKVMSVRNGATSLTAKDDAVEGDVPRTRVYRIRIDGAPEADINIDVAVLFGGVNVAVGTDAKVTEATAVWKGEHVTIPRDDAHLVVGSSLFIAVTGAADPDDIPQTSYTVTYSTGSTLLLLGQPATTTLRSDGSFFYLELNDDASDLFVEVFTAPVSVATAPALTPAEDAAMRALSAGSAVSAAAQGGVFARLGAVTTAMGVSQKFAALAQSVQTALTGKDDDDKDDDDDDDDDKDDAYTLYLSTDPSHRRPGPKTPKEKVRKFTLTSKSRTATVAREDDTFFCSDCRYFAGIYGKAGRVVTVSATTSGTVAELIDGVTVDDYTGMGSSVLYSIAIAQGKGKNMTIIVEPCTGSANLYVSYETYHPGPDDANFRSENMRGQLVLNIPPRAAEKAILSSYTLAVAGAALPPGAEKGSSIVYRVTALSTYKPPLAEPLGPLEAESADVGELTVTAPLAKFRNHKDGKEDDLIPAEDIEYYVFYSLLHGAKAMLDTVCGMTHYEDTPVAGPFSLKDTPKAFDKGKTTVTATLKKLKAGESYTLNVLAVVRESGESVAYGVVPGIKTIGKVPPSYLRWFLFVLIPLVIIGGAAIVYLCMRNRKMSKELAVEMHDVPRSAVRKAVAGPPSVAAGAAGAGAAVSAPNIKANQKYSKLLTEDEEMEDDMGDYAPPQQVKTNEFEAEL